MKKKLLTVSMVLSGCLMLCGCNKTIIDTTYNYDRAIIQLANGEVIEVEIAQWSDYDGEQIQIKAKDGTIYLTSSFRCDLIKDK